jgi:hypothetical protein
MIALRYNKLRLINDFINPLVESTSFILMQTGQFFIVLLLFIVMKLNKFFPVIISVGAAMACMVLYSFVNLLLPYVVRLDEGSTEFLRRWKTVVARHKYLKRKHSGLRPTRFTAGFPGVTFFAFDKSVKADFMRGCIDQTVNLMIGYPEEYLRKVFSQTF